MLEEIEVLKNQKHFDKIRERLITHQFEDLIDKIREYTIELAAKNEVILQSEELPESANALNDFRDYLLGQKRIFEVTA